MPANTDVPVEAVESFYVTSPEADRLVILAGTPGVAVGIHAGPTPGSTVYVRVVFDRVFSLKDNDAIRREVLVKPTTIRFRSADTCRD